MRRSVYLDYNATAPVRPPALAAVGAALAAVGNPSSVHGFGRAARARLETAREQVAALVGARPSQVVFTSGGTEANNLAVAGTGRARILASAIEHDSVLKTAACELIPVDRSGVVDLAVLDRMLAAASAPAIVALMLANNETGVIQPVAEAARIVRAHGALLHCDAVQAAGKIAVDFGALGADLLSVSAHKLGGPPGAGALIVCDDVEFGSRQRGGGQERGRRAGTENLPGIVGFGAAAAAAAGLDAMARVAGLRDDLERRALAAVPGAILFGRAAPRLPNTSCLAVPGLSSEVQVMGLDLEGVAVSAGAACSSGKVQPSQVLRAMGVDALTAGCAIRVSLGWDSIADDVDRFLAAWCALAARARLPGTGNLTAA